MHFPESKLNGSNINKPELLLAEFANMGIKIGDPQYGLLNMGNPEKTGFWHLNSDVCVTSLTFPNGKILSFCEWYGSGWAGGSYFYVYDFDVIPYLNQGCL